MPFTFGGSIVPCHRHLTGEDRIERLSVGQFHTSRRVELEALSVPYPSRKAFMLSGGGWPYRAHRGSRLQPGHWPLLGCRGPIPFLAEHELDDCAGRVRLRSSRAARTRPGANPPLILRSGTVTTSHWNASSRAGRRGS